MLPRKSVEPLEALELELELPPSSAIELSMKEEIIDCADSAVAEDAGPDALDVPAVNALIRL
jgi:hypothetical protein